MPRKKKSRLSAGRKYYVHPPRRKARELQYAQISDHYDSDEYFRSFLNDSVNSCDLKTVKRKYHELVDSDGYAADEFYVILDKPYRYNPHEDLDKFSSDVLSRRYCRLREDCRQKIKDSDFMNFEASKEIKYIQLYDSDSVSEVPRVKLCVTVSKDFTVKIQVHGHNIPDTHEIWGAVQKVCFESDHVEEVLQEVKKRKVCVGNTDEELQELIPVDAYLDAAKENRHQGYRESGYIGSTIRSTSCFFLCSMNSARCCQCRTYRRTLKKTQVRRESTVGVPTPEKDWTKSKVPNRRLTENQKLHKLKQLKDYNSKLEREIFKRRRKVKHQIAQEGVILDSYVSPDFSQIMENSEEEVKKAFPEEQT